MLFDKYNDLGRNYFIPMDSKIIYHEGILKYI